jgi:hypothetical protein
MLQLQDEPVREPSSFDTLITLVGRVADPLVMTTEVCCSCGLTGIIIKQSLSEKASDLVLYRKVIDYYSTTGLAGT